MIFDEVLNIIQQEIKDNRFPDNITSYDKNNDNSTTIKIDGSMIVKVIEGKHSYLLLPKSFLETIYLEECVQLVNLKSLPNHSRLIIDTLFLSSETKDIIKSLVRWFMDNYSAEPFACCSRYIECSDAKYCTHPNQLESKGCFYRSNLENGKIFYGKNSYTIQ